MANHAKGERAPASVKIAYQLIRNTTSPDEQTTGVKSFVANISAFEILKLNTSGNLRDYIAEYNPRKRNRVHDAIRSTIETEPERFITKNSGFVVSASDIIVDDNKKIVTLKSASIINGAQSQGEIRSWYEETFQEEAPDADYVPFYVRVEIIVDPDEAEVVETAISRNTATPVKSISQAGERGQLDELELSVRKLFPKLNIQKSETSEGYDTRKILQYARLLMPSIVSKNEAAAEKLRPYKNPEQCLTEFCDWHDDKTIDAVKHLKYEFSVQMAPHAIQEYEYWEKHEAWNGHRIWEETSNGRACRRDKTGKIVWVCPGLVFPIMSAMSEFVVKDTRGRWGLSKPKLFKPEEMIRRAVAQFRTAAHSDPMQMGRDAGVYDALRIYPNTLVSVMKDVEASSKR